jgi:hypothetical protein
MSAEEWIEKMLHQSNLMAKMYQRYMVKATTQEINESLEDPDLSKVILYLTDLMK